MRLYRNPEVRLFLCVGVPLAVIAWLAIAVASGQNTAVLLLSGGAMVLLFALFLGTMHWHYRKVIRFREKVDKNYSGQRDLHFADFSEGEFSVLQDEIKKMVVAHFRQKEELQAEKEQLVRALTNIMHQIRTPLYDAELLAERIADPEKEKLEKELLAGRILQQTSRIDFFVKTLLDISRIDVGAVRFHRDPMTAQELVQAAYAPLEIAMELNGVELVRDAPETLILHGDKKWLPEALTNILKNCMEHTPAGGKVRVRVTDNAIFTEIVIRDSGTGIDPADLPHIFERYYMGKDAHSNSVGIGLEFTQMVIHALDGTIKAENHPDGGAMFTIRLMKSNI